MSATANNSSPTDHLISTPQIQSKMQVQSLKCSLVANVACACGCAGNGETERRRRGEELELAV